MQLRPIRTTAPASRILSLAEAKAHLRVDVSDDDELIEALILAAESHLDGYSGVLGRCLIDQEWTMSLSGWPVDYLALPFPDVSAVTVRYYDSVNDQQTLDASQYEKLEGARATVLCWASGFSAPSIYSRGDAVQVEMTAGFGPSASDVPAAIIHAAKLLIGGWYENREESAIGVSVATIPASLAVNALIAPFRRVDI